jgi:hypothetical protein
MGKISNLTNGKSLTIIITVLGSLLTFAGTMYVVGQITGQYKEKVDTIEQKTIPKLEVKIETNDAKRQHDMDEIRRLFKTIDSTTLDNYYVLKDIKKDILVVKKKLKIE